MLFKDARDGQILSLSLFLILGISTRDWTLQPILMLVVMCSCLGTQWVMTSLLPYLKARTAMMSLTLGSEGLLSVADVSLSLNFSSLKSAVITGLGLCLLLRANDCTTMAIAGCLAILSKFVFQYNGKHFFNPANFGIIAALIFTSNAWVSPGQWGADGWYFLLFLGTGGMILKQVGRWDTSAAFLLSYTLLEAIRNYWLGWSWDVLQHKLMSGSLLLFAFFMLTDPRSIPNARISRLIWAFALAWLTFILRNFFYLSTGMFWALLLISPLTLILDYFWIAPRFNWHGILTLKPTLAKNTA